MVPTCGATRGGLAALRAGYACSQTKSAFEIMDSPKQFLVAIFRSITYHGQTRSPSVSRWYWRTMVCESLIMVWYVCIRGMDDIAMIVGVVRLKSPAGFYRRIGGQHVPT
jgi:hypothetical protein